MFLEIATTLDVVAGATLATHISTGAISVVLGLVLMASAFLSWNFGFAEEHDRLYVIVASIVLLILAFGLIGSALSV
jgi:uncharacterized membrane protein